MAQNKDDDQPQRRGNLDPAPKATVLGPMDGSVAVQLGWLHGIRVISSQRFRFIKDDLGFEVRDDPEDYLF